MIRAGLTFSLLALFVSTTFGQDISGAIEGYVADSTGGAVYRATITIAGSSLQGDRQAASDERGRFRFVSLPVGDYTVVVTHVGLKEVTVTDVPVRLGQTTNLGSIEVGGEIHELSAIKVSGARPLIDPATPALHNNLRASNYESLPTDRDFQSLVTILPQVNTSYLGDEANVGGSSGSDNVYYIDGANVTDPYRAIGGTHLPYNFVREVQIKRGGYEAEYGKALGSIVNVVTHRGSNEFGGTVFGFFTNQGLAGDFRRAVLDADVGDYATYDAGLSLGGPVIGDKLWYYGAFNLYREDSDIGIPGLGVRLDRQTRYMFAGKVNWRVDPQTDVTFTAFGDPTVHHIVNLAGPGFFGWPDSLANIDPYLGRWDGGGLNFSFLIQRRQGDNLLLDVAAHAYSGQESLEGESEPDSTEATYIDLMTNVYSGGYGELARHKSKRYSGRAHATYFYSQHTFKAGLEYEENVLDDFWEGSYILKYSDVLYEHLYFLNEGMVRNRVPSVFIQDSWSVSERLRLNVGIRWDGQYLIGAGDSVAQGITNQWQPRVGFTYQLGEPGTHKIFGSFGRFYQQMPLHLSSLGHVPVISRVSYYSVDPRTNPGAIDSTLDFGSTVPGCGKVSDLEGEHFDEFSIGYERALGSRVKAGVRGLYRVLRQVYSSGFDWSVGFVGGNPGEPPLDFLPKPKREYLALELSAEGALSEKSSFGVFYVLSRNKGNYTGLFDQDGQFAQPGNNFGLQLAEQAPNSLGLMPNDRTHVFKLFGSYDFDFGVKAGAFFTWQSGTPLNEFGGSSLGFGRPVFLVERGSAGRTPNLWDLNLRFTYIFHAAFASGLEPRLVLDLLHLGSPRTVVNTDQWHYLGAGQTLPNPTYTEPIRYQPPMTARLGLEVGF